MPRVDEHAGRRRDELRRPADLRRDDRAAGGKALEDRLAEGLDEARRAEHACSRDPGRDLVVRDGARDRDPLPALELRAERAVADERQRPLAEPLERAREADDVLALGQRADADEALAGRRDGKALEVDAHVHDLDLADRGGDLALELAPQPVGDGDHRRRATDT